MYSRGVRVEHFSYPSRVAEMLDPHTSIPDPYPYPTRAENCYPTQPGGIPVARTRSLPAGLPLLGIIGLVAYPRPGPFIALVLMNLFSVVENMSCMHH